MKVKAIIERGNDGTFGIYIDLKENRLTYGILGDGNTVKEAIEDFYNSYNEMKEYYKEINKAFQEVEFEFKYDIASFLEHYSKVLSPAGLQRITGINQGQLSHYVTGKRKPRQPTVEKMQKALHSFASEIGQIQFV
jgi:hypothetical protein